MLKGYFGIILGIYNAYENHLIQKGSQKNVNVTSHPCGLFNLRYKEQSEKTNSLCDTHISIVDSCKYVYK